MSSRGTKKQSVRNKVAPQKQAPSSGLRGLSKPSSKANYRYDSNHSDAGWRELIARMERDEFNSAAAGFSRGITR